MSIAPNSTGNPTGLLAHAELHFAVPDAASPFHVLDGLKLAGFACWERRGGRNVTFPTTQRLVNGERMSTALLRPVDDNIAHTEGIRALILDAYAAWEKAQVKT